MAVDTDELVASLKREVSPPGTNLFPNATNPEWLGYLKDGFWEAVLFKVISGYTIDGADRIVPTSGSTDLDRGTQQAIVLYAGWRILLSEMRNLKSQFKAQAGPVLFETQRAASVLAEILRQVKDKIRMVYDQLGAGQQATNVAVFDAIIVSTYAEATGEQWWVR